MKRNISKVIANVRKVAPKDFNEKLERKIHYWAPESVFERFCEFVNAEIIPSSKSATSIAVYAALMGVSERKMRKIFIRDGH